MVGFLVHSFVEGFHTFVEMDVFMGCLNIYEKDFMMDVGLGESFMNLMLEVVA